MTRRYYLSVGACDITSKQAWELAQTLGLTLTNVRDAWYPYLKDQEVEVCSAHGPARSANTTVIHLSKAQKPEKLPERNFWLDPNSDTLSWDICAVAMSDLVNPDMDLWDPTPGSPGTFLAREIHTAVPGSFTFPAWHGLGLNAVYYAEALDRSGEAKRAGKVCRDGYAITRTRQHLPIRMGAAGATDSRGMAIIRKCEQKYGQEMRMNE